MGRRVGAWIFSSIVFALSANTAEAQDTKRACISASTEGQTRLQAGKLLAAREQMLACANDECPGVVKARCAERLREIESRTPSIVVRGQSARGSDVIAARLWVDGHLTKLDGRPIRLDPGEHVIAMEAEGLKRIQQTVLLVESEKSRLVLVQFAEPPEAREPSHKDPAATPWDGLSTTAANGSTAPGAAPEVPEPQGIPAGAWILGGVGVAVLGTSTVFLLKAKADFEDLSRRCGKINDIDCPESEREAVASGRLLGLIGLSAGGAALGTAIIWAIAAHSGKPTPHALGIHVEPLAGGVFASTTGRF
jgi:hypothetical protein